MKIGTELWVVLGWVQNISKSSLIVLIHGCKIQDIYKHKYIDSVQIEVIVTGTFWGTGLE